MALTLVPCFTPLPAEGRAAHAALKERRSEDHCLHPQPLLPRVPVPAVVLVMALLQMRKATLRVLLGPVGCRGVGLPLSVESSREGQSGAQLGPSRRASRVGV